MHKNTSKTNDARHSKSRPAPHCRALPPSEFKGMIYSESFMTMVVLC